MFSRFVFPLCVIALKHLHVKIISTASQLSHRIQSVSQNAGYTHLQVPELQHCLCSCALDEKSCQQAISDHKDLK